jgi:hypothetical protein
MITLAFHKGLRQLLERKLLERQLRVVNWA